MDRTYPNQSNIIIISGNLTMSMILLSMKDIQLGHSYDVFGDNLFLFCLQWFETWGKGK